MNPTHTDTATDPATGPVVAAATGAGDDIELAAAEREAAQAEAAATRRPVPLLPVESERPAAERRRILADVLTAPDPSPGLWSLCDSGLALEVVPELPALRLEQDPIHRHKDVLSHTIAVVAKTRPDLTVRLAALFHDIGKPATRSFEHGGVTFRHHEAVGAKMARGRLRELGFEHQTVKDVAELVRLSGRFKGYADGWSDSAVRRYARDAGHLLGQLNELVRCDCTTRNQAKADRLQHWIDDLEARIVELARQDREAAERPQLDGQAVMARLGIPGGPDVGAALKFLLALKRAEGVLPDDEVGARLDAWWQERLAATGRGPA